jgi:predicted AlkP superfamily phosphohydrolase/phosphomutase
MSKLQHKKVLLVGWDAADWKIIQPLLTAGKMPNLQKLMQQGSYGTVETLDPPLSPMLWTSIATGKTADKHGVLGFIEPDPVNGIPRPAAVTSRNCKAIWNILNQHGLRSNVIGWWPSHPAEPVNGLYVSNMFSKSERSSGLMPATVYPEALQDEIASCRVYPEDISLAEISAFVPLAAGIDQSKDKHLHNLAALLANCRSIFNAAMFALNQKNWNFSAVYFDTIDQCSHTFMKFFPPHMKGVPEEYYSLYKNVVPQMYVFHDMMLGEMVKAAGEDCDVLVLSDHGFYSDHLRPVRLPNDPASPALEHSRFGIVCLSGENILKNQLIKGAGLLDIAPTVLRMFAIPAAKDMDGNVLDVFSDKTEIKIVDSWEQVDGEAGMHKADIQDNSWHSTSAMFQMMELGYIEKIGEDKEKVLKKILDESSFYLAVSFMSRKKHEEAFNILSGLYNEEKPVYRYGLKYAACLQYRNENEKAAKVIRNLMIKNSREIACPAVINAAQLGAEGAFREALDMFLSVEKNVKHLPHLYVLIGNCYASLDLWKDAEEYFSLALHLDHQNVNGLKGLQHALQRQSKGFDEIAQRLSLLVKNQEPDFSITVDDLHNLDFVADQTIDFRKYQLIIRLFLEQFHKGAKMIS